MLCINYLASNMNPQLTRKIEKTKNKKLTSKIQKQIMNTNNSLGSQNMDGVNEQILEEITDYLRLNSKFSSN